MLLLPIFLNYPLPALHKIACVILWWSGAPLKHKPAHILHLSLYVLMFHGLTELQITDPDIPSLGHSRNPDGFCSFVSRDIRLCCAAVSKKAFYFCGSHARPSNQCSWTGAVVFLAVHACGLLDCFTSSSSWLCRRNHRLAWHTLDLPFPLAGQRQLSGASLSAET